MYTSGTFFGAILIYVNFSFKKKKVGQCGVASTKIQTSMSGEWEIGSLEWRVSELGVEISDGWQWLLIVV